MGFYCNASPVTNEVDVNATSFKHVNSGLSVVNRNGLPVGSLWSSVGCDGDVGLGARAMNLKMHAKDLPEYGLRIITPADPSFDGRARVLLKGRDGGDSTESLKPFSIIIENTGGRMAVAYMLQWCFTKEGGQNDCYRHGYTSPGALMEGLPPGYEAADDRSHNISPNRARLIRFVSPDGSSIFRLPVSREEAEQIRAGASPDGESLRRRHLAELAKYTDVTVSLDGVFFDDGTFVGLDATGFFAIVKAEADARHDLLNEIALGLTQAGKSKEEVFRHVERIAEAPAPDVGSDSAPTDFYNFYKKQYAAQVLRMRQAFGDERGLAATLQPLRKPWIKLRKKVE